MIAKLPLSNKIFTLIWFSAFQETHDSNAKRSKYQMLMYNQRSIYWVWEISVKSETISLRVEWEGMSPLKIAEPRDNGFFWLYFGRWKREHDFQ